MIVYFAVEPPHRWVRLDRNGAVQDSGVAENLDDLARAGQTARMVGVVSGEYVNIRTVDLPARTRSKAAAAIPYALEDALASDVDELEFAILEWHSGRSATVAVVARALMETWTATLHNASVQVDALVPDFFCLPSHPQTLYTIARSADGSVRVRGPDATAFALDAYALELWWDELNNENAAVAVNDPDIARQLMEKGATAVSEWNIGTDFTEWLSHGQQPAREINLLQGKFQPEPQRRWGHGYKVAAGLLLAAVLVRIGADAYDYVALDTRNRELDREIERVFRETFPAVTRVVNPRVQMEQRVRALKSGTVDAGEFPFLLSAVARAISTSQANLEELTYRDGELVISCTTKGFAGLDRLKQSFERDDRVQVELLSSGSRDNRVNGRIKIHRSGR